MRTATLLAGLLLAATLLGAAPTASAHHVACDFPPAQNTCDAAVGVLNAGIHYVECYQTTSPKFWLQTCL